MPVKDAKGLAAAGSADTDSEEFGIAPFGSPWANAADVNISNPAKPIDTHATRLSIGRLPFSLSVSKNQIPKPSTK
jgi:hypothetical protein